jgi:hypothetical protein
MSRSPSHTLGELCDVPFSPIDWDGYADIQWALVGNETAELNLLSLPFLWQKFAATHREKTWDENPISLKKLLEHLGVSNYRIIWDRGVRTLEELHIRKTLYIMNIDTMWGIHIDDINDARKDFWEEISRISFGNGDRPYVLLFGKKPWETSPAVLSIIKLVRKITGARVFPL